MIIKDPFEFFLKYLRADNIVITWGFSPDKKTIKAVKILKVYGFKIFWFDGNRNYARIAIIRRKSFDENILKKQMNKLDKWRVPKKINANIINVFDKNGKFKKLEKIAKEIRAI